MIKKLFILTIALGLIASCAPKEESGGSKTLKEVQSRGILKCGVSQGLPGFSNADDQGQWSGLDVDFCRAVAAAVLGDSSKVEFKPLSAKVRFTALSSGEVDVLSRNTTWTFDLHFSNVLTLLV